MSSKLKEIYIYIKPYILLFWGNNQYKNFDSNRVKINEKTYRKYSITVDRWQSKTLPT